MGAQELAWSVNTSHSPWIGTSRSASSGVMRPIRRARTPGALRASKSFLRSTARPPTSGFATRVSRSFVPNAGMRPSASASGCLIVVIADQTRRTQFFSRYLARRIHLCDDLEHVGGRARAAEIKPLRLGAAGLARELELLGGFDAFRRGFHAE